MLRGSSEAKPRSTEEHLETLLQQKQSPGFHREMPWGGEECESGKSALPEMFALWFAAPKPGVCSPGHRLSSQRRPDSLERQSFGVLFVSDGGAAGHLNFRSGEKSHIVLENVIATNILVWSRRD